MKISNMNNNYDDSIESSYDLGESRKTSTKIIPFPKKTAESIKLQAWLGDFHSEEELREVFINMDLAMKYIHVRDFCILSFHPKDIELLNNTVNQVKFSQLMKMPDSIEDKKELVREDIYSSSFLQIGIYSKCLEYLKPSFLKENFDRFTTFLPEGDIPYYKGIVERGASVYFSEYAAEKKKRDLQTLETQFEEEGVSKGRSMVKSNGKSLTADDMFEQNAKINDSIYRELITKDAAYVHFLIYPVIVFLIGLLIPLLIYLFHLF